jgi:hypothetical protein
VTYTQRHVVRLLQSWGFRKIIPWKEHEYQAGKEEREKLKKGRQIFWSLCQKTGMQ